MTRWFRRMKWRWKASRVRRDRCETCQKPLRRNQVVEVTTVWDIDDPRDRIQILGGTGITATYCKRHAPEGARHAA